MWVTGFGGSRPLRPTGRGPWGQSVATQTKNERAEKSKYVTHWLPAERLCALIFEFCFKRTVLDQEHPWQAHRTSLDSHVEEEDTEEREDDVEFAADNDHDYEAMVMKLIILVGMI